MQPFVQGLTERALLRITGPLHFRLILQPLAATLVGIRDGVRDAKAGEPPYLLAVLTRKEKRKDKVTGLWRSLRLGILFAIFLDALVQYMLFRSVRVVGAIVVGTLLMALPYTLGRALANRATVWRIGRDTERKPLS